MSSQRTTSYTGPRPDVVGLVPNEARSFLDVGCSNGRLGEQLKLRHEGAVVWGLEIDPHFAEQARARLDHVIVGSAVDLLPKIDRSFDVIICADVLEHLPEDPADVLLKLRRLMVDSGRIVVSLPNVRFYTTFVELGLRGRWPRHERGVHDRTHRHWFTDADARAMFHATGFSIEASATRYRLRDAPGSHNRRAARFARGPLRPFLAYQLLYRISRAA